MKNIYIKIIQWVAACLANFTCVVVRHLIILKGKDPDYVAPMPLPLPPAPTREDLHQAAIARLNVPYSHKDESKWVRDPSQHPISRFRILPQTKEAVNLQSEPAHQSEIIENNPGDGKWVNWTELVKPLVEENK